MKSNPTLVAPSSGQAEREESRAREFSLERKLLKPCNGRFLDIGCSNGRLVRDMADSAELSVGMDISVEQIREAEALRLKMGADNIAFVVGDVQAPPFRDGVFEVVASRYTLHHTNLDETLPAVRDLVAPGGRLFLRDIATRLPWLQRFRGWHVFLAVLRGIDRAVFKGPGSGWRLFRYLTRPASIRHATVENRLQTHRNYRRFHRRWLPGCDFSKARGMLRLKEAPIVTWRKEAS